MGWGFGWYAGEASAGMGSAPENGLCLRRRRREALAPAPSATQPAPYDSKRTARTPSPGRFIAFTPNLPPKWVPTRD